MGKKALSLKKLDREKDAKIKAQDAKIKAQDAKIKQLELELAEYKNHNLGASIKWAKAT